MKNIRLKYKEDTAIRIQPEINLVEDYEESDDYGNQEYPFPNLYDYINWLEDQLENPIGINAVNAAEAAKKLRLALLKYYNETNQAGKEKTNPSSVSKS